jgi:hypothetical protein
MESIGSTDVQDIRQITQSSEPLASGWSAIFMVKITHCEKKDKQEEGES